MDLTHDAQFFKLFSRCLHGIGGFYQHSGTASRMVWTVFRLSHEYSLLDAQILQQLLNDAFERVEVAAFAVHSDAKSVIFIRQLVLADRVVHEGIADLKCLDGLDISGVVPGQHFQHVRRQHGPHDRCVLTERIDEFHKGSLPGVLIDADLVHSGRAHEGVCLDLVESHAAQCFAGHIPEVSLLRHTRLCIGFRQSDRHLVVAVHSGDFFDVVFFLEQVLTDGRRGDCHDVAFAADLYFQPFEHCDHFFAAQLDAQHIVDPADADIDGLRLLRLRITVYLAFADLAGTGEFDESAETVCSCFCQVRVDALLESGGRLCPQAQLLRCGPDAASQEVRGFQDDSLCIFLNLGIEAAHDAGDADASLRILDHEHVAFHGPFVLIEGDELLAGLRVLYDDLVAVNLLDIEGVHRLAVLKHDEVGKVYDIVDRTHACVHQALLQPPRRLLDHDVRDDPGNIALAALRIFDFYGDVVC